MAFWDNLIQGLKGGQAQQVQTPAPAQPQTQVQQVPQTQAQTPITGAVQNQPPVQDPAGQVQEQAKTNAVVNALKKLAPSTWDDTTRQRVLMTSKFLSGFGGTQYDPNSNLLSNLARGVSNGSNEAYKQIQNYSNYQQAKNMYDQMGLDSSTLNPLADYSALTADKFINLGIQQRKQQTARDIASAKDNTTRLKLIMNGYNKGTMTADEAQKLMQIYGLNITDLQESNDTRKTNSQIEVNEARIKQGEQRIAILKQKVAQGAATQADKEFLNKLNIENKKLLIEQNRLINQGLQDQLGGGGEGKEETKPPIRPVGKSNIVKSF